MSEIYLVEGRVFDHSDVYDSYLSEVISRNPNIQWVVIGVFKDFKAGIINHFIAKFNQYGQIGYYLKVYDPKYKDLRYKDYYFGTGVLPSEEVIYNLLIKGKV